MKWNAQTGAVALAGAATVALLLGGCTNVAPDSPSGGESTELEPLTLAIVPVGPVSMSVDLGLEDGSFEAAGLDVRVEYLDAGPAIINGVIAGQFDLGWAGTVPVISALQGAADLHAVAGGAIFDESGAIALLTHEDSGIEDFADLAGKKVGTNAPRAIGSLGVLAAVARDGGDPATVELVPLPFTQLVTALDRGDVDAIQLGSPDYLDALERDQTIVDIGDVGYEPFAADSIVDGLFFTSGASAEAKQDLLDRFVEVLSDVYDRVNDMDEETWQATYGEFGGVPEEIWSLIIPVPLAVDMESDQLEPYQEAMDLVGWATGRADLDAFLGD